MRRQPFLFVALALVFIAVPYVLQNLALQRTTVINVSLLVGSDPLFAVMLSALLLGERVTGMQSIGVITAFFGAALVTLSGGRPGLESQDVTGSLFAMGAALCWAIHTIIAKVTLRRNDPLITAVLTAVLGTVMLFPVALCEGLSSPARWSLAAWVGILFLGIPCSGWGALAWVRVLQGIDASRAAPLTYFLPVIAWTLSITLLAERPTTQTALGAILVLGGVCLSERNARIRVPTGVRLDQEPP